MNENAKAWVETLRSDEFTQGKGWLRTREDTYCCLGVASELYRRATGDGEWVLDDSNHWVFRAQGLRSRGGLVRPVSEWLGLDFDRFSGPTHATEVSLAPEGALPGFCLTDINDRLGDFNFVADVIEENADRIFLSEEVE